MDLVSGISKYSFHSDASSSLFEFLKKKYLREISILLYVIENVLRTKEISCNNNKGGWATRDLQCGKKSECSKACSAVRWEKKVAWVLADSHKRT